MSFLPCYESCCKRIIYSVGQETTESTDSPDETKDRLESEKIIQVPLVEEAPVPTRKGGEVKTKT